MKKVLALLLSGVLLVGLLAGCGGDGTKGNAGNAGGDATKTIVIGGQSDLNTLDPGNMYEPYANMFSYASYDMLYRIKSGTMGTPEPSVATSYEVDETGLQYTFPLRDDVVFASGNPLTAKDVVWSVNRVLNMPESNAYTNVKNVDKVEAPDDHTVKFTLKQPDASFLVKLTSNAYCILDSEVVKEHGGSDSGGDTAKNWLDQNSAGSGPYILKSWTPKEQLVLEKNPNYWGDAKNIDTIIFREMETADAQITALKNGEVDIILGLNSETAKQLDGMENVEVVEGATALLTFLVMNRDASLSPELSNPKVQEAVRYALDYEGYLALGGEGCTVPLNFVQQGFPGALTRDLSTQGRNLEKAKSLMTEAGYADGFSVTLTCGNNNSEGLPWTTIAQKVKQDLKEIGIEVTIETLETNLVIDKMREGTMPFYIMYWSPDFYDINTQIEAFLPGDTDYGERTKWARTAENENLWTLGSQVMVETDEATRAQVSEELQKAFDQDNPFAFLLQHPKTFAYNSSTLDHVTYNDLCKIELCELTAK